MLIVSSKSSREVDLPKKNCNSYYERKPILRSKLIFKIPQNPYHFSKSQSVNPKESNLSDVAIFRDFYPFCGKFTNFPMQERRVFAESCYGCFIDWSPVRLQGIGYEPREAVGRACNVSNVYNGLTGYRYAAGLNAPVRNDPPIKYT
ncbi:hypothetical protein K0M31_004879, partial [Melipona bicolor]